MHTWNNPSLGMRHRAARMQLDHSINSQTRYPVSWNWIQTLNNITNWARGMEMKVNRIQCLLIIRSFGLNFNFDMMLLCYSVVPAAHGRYCWDHQRQQAAAQRHWRLQRRRCQSSRKRQYLLSTSVSQTQCSTEMPWILKIFQSTYHRLVANAYQAG